MTFLKITPQRALFLFLLSFLPFPPPWCRSESPTWYFPNKKESSREGMRDWGDVEGPPRFVPARNGTSQALDLVLSILCNKRGEKIKIKKDKGELAGRRRKIDLVARDQCRLDRLLRSNRVWCSRTLKGKVRRPSLSLAFCLSFCESQKMRCPAWRDFGKEWGGFFPVVVWLAWGCGSCRAHRIISTVR